MADANFRAHRGRTTTLIYSHNAAHAVRTITRRRDYGHVQLSAWLLSRVQMSALPENISTLNRVPSFIALHWAGHDPVTHVFVISIIEERPMRVIA